METITLEEALELFKLPRTLGEYEGKTVTVGIGRFGPYIQHNKVYVSLPKTLDPMKVTLEEAEQADSGKTDERSRTPYQKI
ncbi:hypothetical protein NXY15_03385 [Bacteroides thetaiotaomicron]|nr:hypothetical protein NXY15_03385 [Bacteroides thetaiotaomicron]